jgi:ethanolamine ammonia-lyase small subunit
MANVDLNRADDDRSRLLANVRSRTPARILVGRSGPAYRTETYLALRTDHAAARDAVRFELVMERDFGSEVVNRYRLFDVATRARSRAEFLRRPDLGRRLDDDSVGLVEKWATIGAEFQVILGDGLSASAVVAQGPELLGCLERGALARGWRFGQPFLVHHCRVGVMNHVGECLSPEVVVLLIGERPGLATSESLSAYLAFRPKPGHTDAQRNVVSNIHARGERPAAAAVRILKLADEMRRLGASGLPIKEDLAVLAPGLTRHPQ